MAVTLDTKQPDYLHLKLLRDDVERVARHARGALLDVGCGSQPYREIFTRHVDQYVGIDLPPERWSKRKGPASVYGYAKSLPFADGTFDTVVSFQVLEHLAEPWLMVAEAARVLRPGGCLILTTCQHYHVHGQPHDYFRFTPFGLVSLGEQANLRPVECTEQGGGWVAVSESVLHYFTGLYWRTLRSKRLQNTVCRLGNKFFGWLERKFPYPGNACNLTLVARKDL
jgi:SAM-dependent methyltransferase